MKIRDLLDSCYEIFYEDIIIGTEAVTLWIYSYQEDIPDEVTRLNVNGWKIEWYILNGEPAFHLVIYI